MSDSDKPEVATGSEGSPATESLENRIARSAEAHATRLGVAGENTAANEEESDAAGADEAEADAEEEAEIEAAADSEKTDDQPWTDDEMARFVAEDPKFYSKLDKAGWARVPSHWATSYKTTQALFTQREQRLSERERALSGDGRPPAKPADAAAEKNAPAVDTAQLVDALNDPERIGEAVEKLADLPGFTKALDRYLESKGINPNALAATSRQTVFDRGYETAAKGMPSLADETVLAEIDRESDSTILDLLRSDNEEAVAFGFRMAAIAAENRLAKSGSGQPPRDDKGRFSKDDPKPKADEGKPADPKVAKLEDAKKRVLDAKARANAKTAPSAAVESTRRTALTDDDPSLSLDERIQRNVEKKLQKVGAQTAP